MNINEDLLIITPISPLEAKEHMNLYREGRNKINDFLELGESFHLYTFKYHAKLLLDMYKSPSDYPAFMVKYGKQTIESKPSIIDEKNKFGTKMTQNAKQESQMGKLVREKQNKSVKETFQQYK